MSKFFDQYSSIIEASLQQVRLRVDPHNKCAEDFAQYDGYIGFILAETDKSVDFYSNNTIITIPRKGFIFEGVLTGLAGTAPAGDTSKRTAVGSIARQAIGTAARIGSAIYGVNLPPGQKAPEAGAAGAGAGIKLPASFDRSTGVKIVDVGGIATLKANEASYGFTKITATNGSGLAIVPESFSQLLNFFTTLLEAAPAFTPQELDAAEKLINDHNAKQVAKNPNYVAPDRPISLLRRNLKMGQNKASALMDALVARKAAAANTPPPAPAPAPQTPPAPAPPVSPAPQPVPASTPPPAPTTPAPTPQTPPAPTPNAPAPTPAAANSFIKTTQIMGNKAVLSKEVDVMMSNMDPNAADKTPVIHKGVFTRLPNAADIIFTFLD